MNLSGRELYSKATRNLKRKLAPGDIDQQFKLVFIYPMLCDKSVVGYEQTMRDFISVSMLKEIFVSNALNIVAMASKKYDYDPLEVQAMISKSVQLGQAGGDDTIDYTLQNRFQPKNEPNPYDLEKKIKEKTAIIKKYLASEPRIKKLNPYVELITLDNLIDVPVIVGTKSYQVDSLTMAYILSAAIALKKPLGGPQAYTNLKYVLNVIRTLDEEDAWTLFQNMVDKENKQTDDKLAVWLHNNYPRVAKKLDTIRASARKVSGYLKRPFPTTKPKGYENIKPTEFYKGKVKEPEEGSMAIPGETFKQTSQFDILEVVKSNIDEAELFFKFMMNPDLLKSQFGLSTGAGQVTRATRKINRSGQLDQLISQANLNFADYIGTSAYGAISSVFNILFPQGSQLSFKDIKTEIIDNGLVEDAMALTNEYGEALTSTFGSEDVNTVRAKTMQYLCSENLKRDLNKIEKISQELKTYRITSPRFDVDELTTFIKKFEKANSVFSGLHDKFTMQISKTVNGASDILSAFDDAVNRNLDELLRALQQDFLLGPGNSPTNIPLTTNIGSRELVGRNQDGEDLYDDAPIMTDPREVNTTINNLFRYLASYIKPFYYVSLIGATCQYVEYYDIEIETVKNDVLDLPNYTLVLPIETIAMLHSAVVSKTWKELVDKGEGRSQHTNLTDNYVKGIVKFVNKRLDIPNLIVVDSKKKQVFYKLQYMSSINKSNIQTFQTYVQNLTKNELESPTY